MHMGICHVITACSVKLSYNYKHERTHSRLTALCPGLPRWASTRKVKPIWILPKQDTVSGSSISRDICKSAPRSRQITMPAPHRSLFYRPDALPAAQPHTHTHNIYTHTHTHTHMHTHTRLTALFPGLPRWAGTRKVKPIWILLKQETVSGSSISWAICKSAPCSRQTTTPASHHSVIYRPDAIPAAQPTASKHWRQLSYNYMEKKSHTTLVFTARCYASMVRAMGLCLSVTSRSSTKTAKRRITQTPHDSPGTLVFWCQRSPRNSTGITSYEGAKCRWGGSKSATFDK